MLLYQKHDLLFNDYDWTTLADHVKFQGAPDRNMFVRHEGNDVLYMINYFCNVMDYKTKTHAGRIEMLIHDKMPIEIKSQKSVFQWLQKEYIAQ